MAKTLPDKYNPADFEKDIYNKWIEKGYFKSRVNPDKKPYTIVIPPPNVTGMLHMGHILNNTIQDILIRYHRMRGYEACWIPGADHASIATESKVTQYLLEQGIKKSDIGREKFLEYAWEWKEKYGGIIINQLKRLGASCDWDRERFTMDSGYYKAVIHAFVELFKKGYIYKGYRLVNWCPISRSAISDEEVYHKEVNGHLWYFKYPIKDSNEFVELATTRPETMLGDTAVAVNPDDKRYKRLIGKTVILPIVNKEIPVIADSYVDPKFGTGVVKITPAHDPNDYEMGKRHDLEFVNIFNDDATCNKNAPEDFWDLDRYEAREIVVEKMRELKFLSKIEEYTHKVGYSERGRVPIEPYLSEQWFMKMSELVKPAIDAVKNNEIKFYPKRWEKTYFNWVENIKDWCISRQLWWGHRIPVYYCEDCGFYSAYEVAPAKCEKCGSENIRQEEDVMDTWSSSWLWPFAVHSWPDIDDDLKYYYPTNTLVTGPDIIFFWVARMIIAGKEFLNEIPFDKVYFTGIIRDDLGRKMSKSLGNSPNPLDVIAEYGADALRYTIMRLAPLGNDILYNNEKCEIGKNFANKIWNAAKFILSNAKDIQPKNILEAILDDFDDFDDFDLWILSRYNEVVKKVKKEIEGFIFNDAVITLYDFIWGEFCAWYIEASKVKLYGGANDDKLNKISVLFFILEGSLKALHPFMPFITEKIYGVLPGANETIQFAGFPDYDKNLNFETEEKNIGWLQEIVYAVRNIRGENNIAPHINVNAKISIDKDDGERSSLVIENNKAVILKLGKIGVLDIVKDCDKSDNEVAGIGPGFEIFISLEGIVDVDKEKERLSKEIDRFENSIKKTTAKLSNKNFVEKAPEAVVEKEKSKLDYLENELRKLQKNLSSIK